MGKPVKYKCPGKPGKALRVIENLRVKKVKKDIVSCSKLRVTQLEAELLLLQLSVLVQLMWLGKQGPRFKSAETMSVFYVQLK